MSDEAVKRAAAQALRAMRTNKGYTQSYVAAQTGTSQALLSQWENGKVTPRLDNVVALASTYEVPVSDLVPTHEDIDRARKLLAREE
jgi:transcriptional regulator with XRE-family HTH domain